MYTNKQHVVLNLNGGWSVKRTGTSRAAKTFPTKEEAIAYGRLVAKNKKTELVVHRRDGTVGMVYNYEPNLSPTRG